MNPCITIVFLVCLLVAGCMGGQEKINIVDASIARSGAGTYYYRGSVEGENAGTVTYKMCVVDLRTGGKGGVSLGTVEKSKTFNPGDKFTINLDEKYRDIAAQVVLCCYQTEAYSGAPTCSQSYNITE